MATSSLDGTVRLYDSRSARLPLQRCDLPQDTAVTGCTWCNDKVLALAAPAADHIRAVFFSQIILSSGSDGKVRTHMIKPSLVE